MSKKKTTKKGEESPEAAQMSHDIESWKADVAELEQDIVANINASKNPEFQAQARAILEQVRKIGNGGLGILSAMHRGTVQMDAMLAEDGENDVEKFCGLIDDVFGRMGNIVSDFGECLIQLNDAIKRWGDVKEPATAEAAPDTPEQAQENG